MRCKNCEHIIVMHAFSEGKCDICGGRVVTGHIPCYRICKGCSEKNSKCEQCGKKIK